MSSRRVALKARRQVVRPTVVGILCRQRAVGNRITKGDNRGCMRIDGLNVHTLQKIPGFCYDGVREREVSRT